MNEIAGAITGLTTAYNVLKAAVTARDDAMVKAAQIDMQEKLLNVSTMALSQLQSSHALELEAQELRAKLLQANAHIQDVERRLENRGAYVIAQPAPGQFARLPVGEFAGPADSTAYFCATCYADGKEVPLRYSKPGPGINALLTCPMDRKHSLNLGGALPVQSRQRSAGIATREW